MVNGDHDQAAGDKLDAYIVCVQQALDRCQVSPIQLTFSDKSSFLNAAVGAPTPPALVWRL